MDTSEIIEKVVDAIEDDSFSKERILGFINKGMGRVAMALPLPDLTVSQTLTLPSGSRTVILPPDYHTNLFWAFNVTADRHIDVIKPLTNFLRRYPARMQEDVRWVCVHGKTLYYEGCLFPVASQDIDVLYSSRPVELDFGDDVLYIDPFYQEDLLVNFATAECYNLIETGIEGVKVNFNKFMSLYTLALEEYREVLGLKEENPDFVQTDRLYDTESV